MTIEMDEAQGSGKKTAPDGDGSPLRGFPHPFWGLPWAVWHQRPSALGSFPQSSKCLVLIVTKLRKHFAISHALVLYGFGAQSRSVVLAQFGS